MTHHEIGEVFINPNAIPSNIAHIVARTTPEKTNYPSSPEQAADHLIYFAICGVLGHEIQSWGTLQACEFIAASKEEAKTLVPETQLCPTCFNEWVDDRFNEDGSYNKDSALNVCDNFHYPPDDYYTD